MTHDSRPYRGEDDFWRIREFLRSAFLANDRHSRPWDLLRFDYWRRFIAKGLQKRPFEDCIVIWEDAAGVLATLQADNPGDVFLLVRPGRLDEPLVREMVAVAEDRLSIDRDGKRWLRLWAMGDDDLSAAVYSGRGYKRQEWFETLRRRPLLDPVPEVPLAPGYAVRSLGTGDEIAERTWVSWRVFHPDEPDDKYPGSAWYPNLQSVPQYRRDLDLVAVAPDGHIAAFTTVWFDDVTRVAVFEPVGTDPAHQRKGLARAVMTEGLRRAQVLGANLATVSGYSVEANALYASMGFTDTSTCYPWEREW